MLTARASTRSDFSASRARSTADSGGGPGRNASQATWVEDTTNHHATVSASHISDSGCSLPCTGTAGNGSSRVTSNATASPETTLATVMLPHNNNHTRVSQTSTQIRSAHAFIAAFPTPH